MALSNGVTVADFHQYQYDLQLKREAEAAASQTAADPNTEQALADQAASLELLPYEDMDRGQSFAGAGTAVPIVFGEIADGIRGGVWLSPPLVDTISDNFTQKFVYLISQGDCSLQTDAENYYLGSKNVKDLETAGIYATPVFANAYTTNTAVCPLSSNDCTHNNFYILHDPLTPEVASYVIFRTIGEYADRITARLRPLYPDGEAAPTVLETYDVNIDLINNNTGNVTNSIGSLTTTNDGTATADFVYTTSSGVYTYVFTITAVNTAAAVKPETILLEIEQRNVNPDSEPARIAQYAGITFLEVTGNLYNLEKQFSPPTDLKQLHVFVQTGVEVTRVRWIDPTDKSLGYAFTYNQPSDSFAELIYYYFSSVLATKYPQYGGFVSSLFNPQDVAECYLFWEEYKVRFNGVIGSTTNFLSFAQETAPFFLSKFYNQAGYYRIKLVLPVTSLGLIDSGELTPKRVFTDIETTADSTANTFMPGSYVKTYFDPSRRLPVQLNLSWRDTRKTGINFVRTTNIRYDDYPNDSPIETYDLSAFCTRSTHVITFAKHLLASRRYSTHQIAFQTLATFDTETPEDNLEVMDLIEVVIHRVNSVGDNATETNHYLVDSIVTGPNNVVTITATHHPLDPEGGFSIINNEILTADFDTI